MFIAILFLLGTVVGSFLNVLIDRLPKGVSPFKGRSRCDYCRKTLSPIDLVPVFSFLLIGGRCRYCKKKLSWQYPIVEFVTGIMFSLLFIQSSVYLSQNAEISNLKSQISIINFLFNYLPLLIIFSSFLIIFVVDFKYQIIPDEMLVSALLGILLFKFLSPNFSSTMMYEGLLAGIVGAGFFLVIYLATKGRGMGFGDIKLAFVLGFFLGLTKTLVGLYLAFLTGAFVSIILILTKNKRLKNRIAFGPFLVFGATISFYFGDKIFQWYLALFL